MPRTRLLTALVAASLLVGCGGSSASSTSSTALPPAQTSASVTRAAYIARADALCAATDKSQATLRKRAKGLSLAKLPPILRVQATIANQLAGKLRSLKVPVGDQVPTSRFVNSLAQIAVLSTAVANSIQAGHARAVAGLRVKFAAARAREATLAQGYGYRVCGSNTSY